MYVRIIMSHFDPRSTTNDPGYLSDTIYQCTRFSRTPRHPDLHDHDALHIEDDESSITVEVNPAWHTEAYVMNDTGQTINKFTFEVQKSAKHPPADANS